MQITVRPAESDDAEAVARIHVQTWQAAYDGLVPADYLASLDVDRRTTFWRTRLTDPAPVHHTVVATRPSGVVVGFADFGWYPIDQDFDNLDRENGSIHAIYLDPAHQGLGAGRALMDTAVTTLTGLGVQEVRLWVLETNAAARRFYERYGLSPDGERIVAPIRREGRPTVELVEVRYALRLR